MVKDTLEEDTVVVENVIEVTKKRSQRQLLAIPDYDAVQNAENSFENFAVDSKKEVKKDQVNAASAFETSTTMAVANVKRKILGEVDNNVDVKRKLSSDKTLLTGQRNLILASVLDSLKKEQELARLDRLD